MFHLKSDQINELCHTQYRHRCVKGASGGLIHGLLEDELRQTHIMNFDKMTIAVDLESKRKEILK